MQKTIRMNLIGKILCHLSLTFLFSTPIQTRLFSTNLQEIIETIRQKGISLADISPRNNITISTNFRPLVTLQCDSSQFVAQVQNHWNLYTTIQFEKSAIPPLYVNPNCDSFFYRHFRWTPESWNMLEHEEPAKQFSFEMINFDIIEKPLYIITNETNSHTPHNMFFSESSDAILFMSYTLSHFYEKFQSVRFKLVVNNEQWPQAQIGPCFVALEPLTLIKTSLHTFGLHLINNAVQCNENKLVRLHQQTPSTFALHFPKGKLTNIVPLYRKYKEYIRHTNKPDVLDFQWSTNTDTGYTLLIQVGTPLTSPPKIWWIHRQSDSLLGYHDNFFEPEHLRTSQIIHSFARNNCHYYPEGLYVKMPEVKYLTQNVIERNYTMQSWPLPTKTINTPDKPHEYCKPRLGALENGLNQANRLLENSLEIKHLNTCNTNYQTLKTAREDHTNYHQNAIAALPLLKHDILSYDYVTADTFHTQLVPQHLKKSQLQIALNEQLHLLNTLWGNMQPRVRTLQTKLFLYHTYRNQKLFFLQEKQFYSNTLYTFAIYKQRILNAQHMAIQQLNEITHLRNYFMALMKTIQRYFQTIYLLKLAQIMVQTLKHNQLLQANILYKHTIVNGEIISHPVKRKVDFFINHLTTATTAQFQNTINNLAASKKRHNIQRNTPHMLRTTTHTASTLNAIPFLVQSTTQTHTDNTIFLSKHTRQNTTAQITRELTSTVPLYANNFASLTPYPLTSQKISHTKSEVSLASSITPRGYRPLHHFLPIIAILPVLITK